jgi:hypothetical protein
MSLVVPHAWVAGTDYGTATNLNTLTDAIVQMQGGTPVTGTVLDFAVLRQVVTQNLTNATWTTLTFTQEDLDAANGHSNVSNTSRYVMGNAGYADVRGIASFTPNATGQRSVRVLVNGAVVNASQVDTLAVGASTATSVAVALTVPVSAGDYVELQAYQTSTATLATYSAAAVSSRLEVRWIHV